MVKKIVIVIVVLIAALLIFAATRPDTFHVQREAAIKAPPEKIFPLVNDFRNWGKWSPWEKLDPAMKRTLSGAATGKGSVYEWEGNSDVGKGRMEITDAIPSSKIAIKLDFLKPMEAHNAVNFTLEAKGGVTNVTWMMHGKNNYFAKLMHIFFNVDRMVGKDFETGLSNMKALAEK